VPRLDRKSHSDATAADTAFLKNGLVKRSLIVERRYNARSRLGKGAISTLKGVCARRRGESRKSSASRSV
jgi:hypothetical protein